MRVALFATLLMLSVGCATVPVPPTVLTESQPTNACIVASAVTTQPAPIVVYKYNTSAFIWGMVAGTFAFWVTVYQDMKKRAMNEANFWKQEYKEFQDKVRQAIDIVTNTSQQKDSKSEDRKK